MLKWGSLPKIFQYDSQEEKEEFLYAYVTNYIKSEIQEDQWVRKIEPFRKFLPIAAQMNGKIINYSNISKDVGVDDNTIKAYFEILEDTLLGFHLPSFHLSIRKQQRKASKFFLIDPGIKRALARQMRIELQEHTSEYGFAFEHWVILEIYKLKCYFHYDYELSYFLSKDGVEIDLIISRPGKSLILIKINSNHKIKPEDARHLISIGKEFKDVELYLLSQDPMIQNINAVKALPWQLGVQQLFSLNH